MKQVREDDDDDGDGGDDDDGLRWEYNCIKKRGGIIHLHFSSNMH